jgi:hypothetical protein
VYPASEASTVHVTIAMLKSMNTIHEAITTLGAEVICAVLMIFLRVTLVSARDRTPLHLGDTLRDVAEFPCVGCALCLCSCAPDWRNNASVRFWIVQQAAG